MKPPEGPPVDAPIAITDPGLRVAIAQALGIPVTESYIPGQYLIHVDGGSQRTDLSLLEAPISASASWRATWANWSCSTLPVAASKTSPG